MYTRKKNKKRDVWGRPSCNFLCGKKTKMKQTQCCHLDAACGGGVTGFQDTGPALALPVTSSLVTWGPTSSKAKGWCPISILLRGCMIPPRMWSSWPHPSSILFVLWPAVFKNDQSTRKRSQAKYQSPLYAEVVVTIAHTAGHFLFHFFQDRTLQTLAKKALYKEFIQ